MTDIAISDVLARMREITRQMQPDGASAPAPSSGLPDQSFSALLARAVDGVAGAQTRAGDLARAFESGAPGVELAQVMVATQQASVAFTAVTQVRNKLIAAYQDIMNMPL